MFVVIGQIISIIIYEDLVYKVEAVNIDEQIHCMRVCVCVCVS